MKISCTMPSFVLWILLAQCWNGPLQAQTPLGYLAPTADFTYHLQRFAVAGTKPTVYLWTLTRPVGEAVSIDGDAFKSLASPTLRQWIIEWQHNGTVPITYIADEKLDAGLTSKEAKSARQQIDNFAQFCRDHGEPFFMSRSSK